MTGKRNNPLVSEYWTEAEPLLDARVGTVLTIEELLAILPAHKDGRRPRGKTLVRRLRHRLEVVSRGENRRLGSGSSFRVLPAPSSLAGTSNDLEQEFMRLMKDVQKDREVSRMGSGRRPGRRARR